MQQIRTVLKDLEATIRRNQWDTSAQKDQKLLEGTHNSILDYLEYLDERLTKLEKAKAKKVDAVV